ncbi:hypothetical protein [Planococcus sp. YIM B11945]|uniref:hypothetical protein n=1 Tax=Planococcus sp. YIM B11945 TaxID=3435410 RepID=UPI003D7E0C76
MTRPKRLEGLGAGVWTEGKAEAIELGSTSIRQTGEVAFFAAQPGWLMTPRA